MSVQGELVQNTGSVGNCSRAQSANASAVLVSAVEGEDVIPMNCEGKQCQLALHTFATMIPYATALASALSPPKSAIPFGDFKPFHFSTQIRVAFLYI